jgi:hypothetical protein
MNFLAWHLAREPMNRLPLAFMAGAGEYQENTFFA